MLYLQSKRLKYPVWLNILRVAFIDIDIALLQIFSIAHNYILYTAATFNSMFLMTDNLKSSIILQMRRSSIK